MVGSQLRELGILSLEVVGQRLHQLEVFAHLHVGAVVEDLDRDGCPVSQRGPMHLGHRAGGERLVLERAEQLRDRTAQLRLHRRHRHPRCIGGH